MPRTARAAVGGVVYHVLNSGNGRTSIFRKPEDYLVFIKLLLEGKEKARVELFGFCLMPNHWHLILCPKRAGDLSTYLSWVTNTHVKRYRSDYPRSSGHLYQGRYKSFPVQEDDHFLMLQRYVESNPRRAKLVGTAQEWPWSSLGYKSKNSAELLDAWPKDRPRNWKALVNQPQEENELKRIIESMERGRPLGSDKWTVKISSRLGLQYTLNPRGRPRKAVSAK